jgi:small-conductance mechanosensitive channel
MEMRPSPRPSCASLLLALTLAAATPIRAQDTTPPEAGGVIETAPVILDGAVLFRVRGASSLSAHARAAAIQQRLITVADEAATAVDAVRTVDDGTAARIVAGGTTLMAVLDADGALEQLPRSELAAIHAARMKQAIVDYRSARSASAVWRGALNAVAATAAVALTLFGTWWMRRSIERLLTRRWQQRIHSVGIQSFEVMRADRIWQALRGGLRTVQSVVWLAALVIYVAVVLAQFPWTRASARSITAVAAAPLQLIGAGIVANIPGLLFLVVLFLVLRLALRMIRLFFDAIERGRVTLDGFDAEWAQPTYKMVRLALVAFGLIVAYPYIPGSQSAAFKGISLFVGVVFSLGSSSLIANILAGYMMTYRRAFKVGDRIKVGDAIGDVIEMRLQVTHLRSIKNEEIVVPNSQILTGEIVNYSSLAKTRGLILHTTVGIGYETPWRQVEAMLLMAAARTAGVSAEPRPFVLERALGDFAVTYELNVYCADVSAMLELYAALHRHILDVFNEYGVQIMTPAYERDPPEPKIVSPKDWYPAPVVRPPAAEARHSQVVG